MAGWTKTHRKILDNPIFKKPELFQLFSYCVLMANHIDKKIIMNGNEITVERGSFVTGRKVMANDTGQGESAIYKRLKVLENLKMISVKSNNRFSVLRVLNYCIYQGSDIEEEQPSNNKVTTKEQPSNTTKNDKELKEPSCQTNKFADDAIELILACELYDLMLGNNPNIKEPNLQSWAKTFDLMIRRDKGRTVEIIRQVMKWSQKDTFWQGNILSANKLREKFDQLSMRMKQIDKPLNMPNRNYSNLKL